MTMTPGYFLLGGGGLRECRGRDLILCLGQDDGAKKSPQLVQPPIRARSDIRYSKPHAQSNVIRL